MVVPNQIIVKEALSIVSNLEVIVSIVAFDSKPKQVKRDLK